MILIRSVFKSTISMQFWQCHHHHPSIKLLLLILQGSLKKSKENKQWDNWCHFIIDTVCSHGNLRLQSQVAQFRRKWSICRNVEILLLCFWEISLNWYGQAQCKPSLERFWFTFYIHTVFQIHNIPPKLLLTRMCFLPTSLSPHSTPSIRTVLHMLYFTLVWWVEIVWINR